MLTYDKRALDRSATEASLFAAEDSSSLYAPETFGARLWAQDDEENESINHHLVPARLVRVAHRLKQIDESDDTNTIAALSRMKLPQMTGQIRDVEQRALELNREEGREDFRIKALQHNLTHHSVPPSVMTLTADRQRLHALGVGMSLEAAGTLASACADLLPLGDRDEDDEDDDGEDEEDGEMEDDGGFPFAGGASGRFGRSGAACCMHGIGASSYAGLSHTATAAAARANNHSLSSALSKGTSESLEATIAAGNPCGGRMVTSADTAAAAAASSGGWAHAGSSSIGASDDGSSNVGSRSSFRCRVVSAESMAARTSAAAVGRSNALIRGASGYSTVITMRGGYVDTNSAPKPLDTRPGAPDHALWYGP